MICAKCGRDNPTDNRFCGRCGHDLSQPADKSAGSPPAQPASSTQGERRQATVPSRGIYAKLLLATVPIARDLCLFEKSSGGVLWSSLLKWRR
ncbi:MAG: zinc ribbon domain-containing protein [SAR324 cluster bacterium]|nr:zinc ribbon domain-containing protein [SAR324 cluster bacterium]